LGEPRGDSTWSPSSGAASCATTKKSLLVWDALKRAPTQTQIDLGPLRDEELEDAGDDAEFDG
jgi:hypothetical protein